MKLDELAHKGEANAKSAFCDARTARCLREDIKNMREHFACDAHAIIAHAQDSFVAVSRGFDRNHAARRGVFNGIVDEVGRDLNEPDRVA